MVATIAISLVLALLLVALTTTQYSGRVLSRELTFHGQTLNAAQAGLTEGLSWFRRQTNQPVRDFIPVRDINAVPPVIDTDDDTIGLVREYQISAPGRVWGRYELRKTPAAGASSLAFKDPLRWASGTTYAQNDIVVHASQQGATMNTSYYRSRSNSNTNKNPATTSSGAGTLWWDVVNTMDVSKQKGKTAAGLAWQLESEGIVYVRNNAGVAYNVSPNRVLSRTKLRTEIQRLGLNLPALAAVSAARGDRVIFPSGTCPSGIQGCPIRIRGGTQRALQWTASTGTPSGGAYLTPNVPQNTQIIGPSPTASAGITALPNRFTIPYVFGVSQTELESMADVNVATVAALPATLPGNGLMILRDPNNSSAVFTFDENRPLTGTGVLVVFGDLVIDTNSNSSFNGVVFVDGSYSQAAPSSISGAVIVNNTGTRTFTMSGAGERSEIRFDQNVIDFIEQRMGQYRVTRSPYVP
jgi:hypothetical protein